MSGYDEAWLKDYEAKRSEQRSAARDPMLAMGEPPAVEESNTTGSYRRAGVALRTPEAAGESGPQRPTKRNKFGAVRTVAPASWGGTRLADSKAGAQLARTLDTRKQVGSILDWAEEVSIPVGVDEDGKVIRYRADALVLLGYVDAPDGGEPALVVRLVDAKKRGMDTPTSKAKRAALRARGWNVEIHET